MADPANRSQDKEEQSGRLELVRETEDRFSLEFGKGWPEDRFEEIHRSLAADLQPGTTLRFVTRENKDADSRLVSAIINLIRLAEKCDADTDTSSLPASMQKLISLARAGSRRQPPERYQPGWVERIGRKTFRLLGGSRSFIEFLGELTYSAGRLFIGRARFRRRDFWVTLEECSVSALPIVALLAILTGTILGFVGAVQLRKFGATIYMTDLVGLAMAREMGCLMTGVIMSGRTGAAFAAQIGTMKVNQEIDALRTVGLSPVEFLVLPRALALFLMMPLLTLFADVLGWTGGFLVSLPMGINPAEYWQQLRDSLGLGHILFGLSKSFFFGAVIAISGCYYGLVAKRNSAAVGLAATRAVVASITWIVVLDAIFAFMDEILSW